MKSAYKALIEAIRRKDAEAVERLLGELEGALPECFLREAELTGDQSITQLIFYGYYMAGFDDGYADPIMRMVKLGFITVAMSMIDVTPHRSDYTNKDENGLSVIDWAEVLGADELVAALKEAKSKAQQQL